MGDWSWMFGDGGLPWERLSAEMDRKRLIGASGSHPGYERLPMLNGDADRRVCSCTIPRVDVEKLYLGMVRLMAHSDEGWVLARIREEKAAMLR